jgi:NAD(P)-dependent dehydrogenase (short-subunit alcohol dehydrogenase family)
LFEFCTYWFDSRIRPPGVGATFARSKSTGMEKKVWYVTGASKGLGLALIKKLVAEGHEVAATSRSLEALEEAMDSAPADQFLPLEVDLADDLEVAGSLLTTYEVFGRIDVVINNAGYGIDAAPFAPATVIRQVMPYLRAQRSGHIINISSTPGFARTLSHDVRELGIHVTEVAPGAFRTRTDDCEEVHDSHTRYFSIDGKQIGDPVKAASALIEVAASPCPPTLVFLGSDAYNRATAKMRELERLIAEA